MANNFKQANAAVNGGIDAIGILASGGKLRIYDGTQAVTADTAIGAQVLLAELTLSSAGGTAFNAAAAGVATAKTITSDTSANATGTASWFRVVKSDGTTSLFDGSVGTSSADLILNTVSIVAAVEVAVSSLTYTWPKS